MRIRNLFTCTRQQYSIEENFHGIAEGNTFTATEDKQYFLPWVNIPQTTVGDVWSALVSDVHGKVEASHRTVVFAEGLITTSIPSWGNGLLMSNGASLTFVMRGSFASTDWQTLQALGVGCFDKDTAAY